MKLQSNTATKVVLALATCNAIAGLSGGYARAQGLSEYQVKAAFLYNFARFVDWPEDSTQSSFDLCILGENPVAGALEGIIKDKNVNGRPVVMKRLGSVGQARGCQVLFVAASEGGNLRSILDSVKGSPVLTVGETPGFARLGGMINFIIEDERVRFEVNVDAANRARLKISSKLLSLARIVREPGNRG